MSSFGKRLMTVISDYRASIESGHFGEVDRDLGDRSWMRGEDSPPVTESIVDMATELFDELHGAVANRDREAALASIERIRTWLHDIWA